MTCPTCGKEAKVVPPDRNAEAQEYESVALGIHPTQIAEAREKFPHHRFLSNGNMLIKGQREKDRVLKDLGYVEYDNKNQMKQPDKGKY